MPASLLFTYVSRLHLHVCLVDVRQVSTVEISDLAGLAAAQFLLHAVIGASPDYCVGSLCLDHIGAVVLFRLPSTLINVSGRLKFFKITELARMNPVLLILALHQSVQMDYFLPKGPSYSVKYYFVSEEVRGYLADIRAPGKLQKLTVDPVFPVKARTVNVH